MNRIAIALRIVLPALGLLLAGAARADKVIMHDGRVLEGKVTETPAYVYVESRFGRLPAIPRDQVREVVYDAPGAAAGYPGGAAPDELDLSAMPQATRAEPMVFALMRRLLEAEVGLESGRLRGSLNQWRIAHHDGLVKLGTRWVKSDELARRRGAFAAALKEGNDLLAQAQRITPRTQQDRTEQARLTSQGLARLQSAASTFPDEPLGHFLAGQLALLQDNHIQALRLFDLAATAQPLVAGFLQGRAMACDKLGRALDAMNDYAMLLRLSETPDAWHDLSDAMKRVPGHLVAGSAYQDAKALLGQYETPPARRSSYTSRGTRWAMPGGDWTAPAGGLTNPGVDGFLARRAVAVPVSDTGLLVVDPTVLSGALGLWLEIRPGHLVPAEPVRLSSYALRDASVPLAAVRVSGYTFTPLEFEPAPALQENQPVVFHAVSLPAELGDAGPRRAHARVRSVGADGSVALDAALLPGESAGPVLDAQGRLVSFLAGRIDPMAEQGGPDAVIPPTSFAQFAAAVAKSGTRSSSYGRYGALKRKDPPQMAEGTIFVLHALIGQGGPAPSR